MSDGVILKSNLPEVLNTMDTTTAAFLTMAALEVTNQAKINTRVDTGQTRAGWSYEIENNTTAIVGNIEENAIWEEFGTGIYAEDENGNKSGKGRQTGWVYVDKDGEGHFTRGKTPTHALSKAMDKVKTELEDMAVEKFRSGMK